MSCDTCWGLGFTTRHETRANGTPYHDIVVVMERCRCATVSEEATRANMTSVRDRLEEEVTRQILMGTRNR